MTVITHTERETEEWGYRLAGHCRAGTVVALFGDLGAGKTAFVRGMARSLSPDAFVSSPTFALVNDYGGDPPLVHFDMYRIDGWDDLETTGYYDYREQGAVLAVEWSEHIEGALPQDAIRVTLRRLSDTDRELTVEGVTL